MRKPHPCIEDLPQHFEVEPDGTEVSVLDCEVSWSRRNGGTWVRARSPKADASMRHPRKAHVKVADVEPEHQAAPEPRRVVSARRVTLFLAHSEVTP